MAAKSSKLRQSLMGRFWRFVDRKLNSQYATAREIKNPLIVQISDRGVRLETESLLGHPDIQKQVSGFKISD